MGVAVPKYRLYAIDRIISRVIAYGIVTAVLGGIFAGYDAETVIAAFTARLRRTVDLDTVQGDLVATVDAAFQPRARVGVAPAEVTSGRRGG